MLGSYYSGSLFYEDEDVCHSGRKGMKWGQNIFNTYAEYLRKIGEKKTYTTTVAKKEKEDEGTSTRPYVKPTYTSSGTKVFGSTDTTTTTKKKKKTTKKKTSKRVTSKKTASKKSKTKTTKTISGGAKTTKLKYAGNGKASKDVMNFLKS